MQTRFKHENQPAKLNCSKQSDAQTFKETVKPKNEASQFDFNVLACNTPNKDFSLEKDASKSKKYSFDFDFNCKI